MIRFAPLAGLAGVTIAALASAKPGPAVGGRALRPAPPLPSLPSIARVHVEASRDHVVVLYDVWFPRGEWQSGDLDLYVAFGAPGAPRAFDARLYASRDGAALPALDDAGDPITTERAPHRPPSAQVILGRAQMAGAILHVKETAFRRASSDELAIVRVRELLELPVEDARGAREIVVRLGAPSGFPIALHHVELLGTETRPWITRAEAQLCGADADAYPLSLALSPAPSIAPPPPERPPLAPPSAIRRVTDDLCVRFWER